MLKIPPMTYVVARNSKDRPVMVFATAFFTLQPEKALLMLDKWLQYGATIKIEKELPWKHLQNIRKVNLC